MNNGMEVRGSHLILLVSILFPVTMAITFTLAVTFEHVYPFMPFMSYTGDLPVESCLFSLGLNLIATFYVMIVHIRYNQVLNYCGDANPAHANTILRLNRKSVPWGIASSVGLSVTGSFQELHMANVHRFGALTCSYSGFVYMWFQTILSDLLVGELNTRRISYLRTLLTVGSTIIHVVAPVLVAVLDLNYPRCHEDTLVWRIGEEGWHLHVCCSLLEWTIFIINVTYLASFYPEFKPILIKKNEILFDGTRREQDEEGTSGHKKHK